MMETSRLIKKAMEVVRNEGISGCAKKTKDYLENQKSSKRNTKII